MQEVRIGTINTRPESICSGLFGNLGLKSGDGIQILLMNGDPMNPHQSYPFQ